MDLPSEGRNTAALVVSGSRNWTDKEEIEAKVREFRDVATSKGLVPYLYHGCAKGADAIATAVAEENGVNVKGFRADWHTHGKRAGPRRNREMLKHAAENCALVHVACFPDESSRGTWGAYVAAYKMLLDGKVAHLWSRPGVDMPAWAERRLETSSR